MGEVEVVVQRSADDVCNLALRPHEPTPASPIHQPSELDQPTG